MTKPPARARPRTDPDCRGRHSTRERVALAVSTWEGRGVQKRRTRSLRLLSLGAGPRLALAALIVAALWGAFFWATSTPAGP